MKVEVGVSSGTQPKVEIDDCGDEFSPSRISNAMDFLASKKGLAIVGGALFGPPFVFGLSQGLNPIEAAAYGFLQIATIKSKSPETEAVRKLLGDITSGNPAAGAEISAILSEVEETYKSLLVEAGVIGGVVAFMQRFVKRGENERQATLEGRAEYNPGNREIAIILGGEGSHILDAVIDGHRSGFIPVVETPEAARALADELFKGKPHRPFCIALGVPDGEKGLSYLDSHGWDNLKLNEQNLIHAANGENYLLVVGIGMKPDTELSFDPGNISVTQPDLRSAGLMLKQKFEPQDLNGRNLIDLYIGNGGIKHTAMETGNNIADRELAKATGVDIYVDTWDVALKALVDQLISVGAKQVRLATSDLRHHGYRETFGAKFKDFVKRYAPDSGLVYVKPDEPAENPTWIVYEGRSQATFVAARTLRKAQADPKTRIIALVTTDLEKYSESGGLENVKLVDISGIIAKMLKDVRQMLKEGHTPDEIQAVIDGFKLPLSEEQIALPKAEPTTTAI